MPKISEDQVVKVQRQKGKPEPLSNNYFTLFTEQERVINGQLAATKHRFNNFTILTSNRLWSFKFDHIIKTNFSYLAASQPEGGEQESDFDQYTNLEVSRFLDHNKNLIYVNMTEECSEKLPTQIPEFPKVFYDK